MQCTNYLPGYYYPRDNVVNITGNSRSISHSDITRNSSSGFHLSFPPLMVDETQDLVYQKEILRQTILNHEATFRYQVNELHRLYGRQRELMDEMKKRQLIDDKMHLQASEANTFMSLFRSEISEKTFRRTVNIRSIDPYAPSKEMFQEPLISGADKTVQPGGDCFSGLNILNECNASSSKNNTTRKRMLDLELPAEKTINNEDRETFQEENPAKKTITLISELRPQCSSKVNVVASGDSSSSPSSCRGTFLLFDLNEPVQPIESECPNSAFESNNIHKEIGDKDLDLPGVARAECSTLNKEGRDESNLKSFEEDSSVGRALFPFSQPASLPLENEDKIHAETRTDKSPLISSWSKFKQIPVAVQALSCLNTNASFCKSTESSVRNSSLTAKKFNMNLGPPSSPTSGSLTSCFMQHDASDSTGEQIAAVKDKKFSEYTSSEKGVDLNLTPSIRLSHCQSAPSSKISHLNFPEGRNVETHKKSEVPDSNMVPDSTAEDRKCTRDSHLVGCRIDSQLSTDNICIDLNSCIKEDLLSSSPSEATKSTAERDLEGPVSPENKECSPPRGDSQDINSGTSIHLPRRGHDDPVKELDTVAADILIFISSSMVHRAAEMATRYLTRSLLTTLSRSFTPLSLSAPLPSSFSLLRLRPLVAVAANLRTLSPATSLRGFATRQTSSSLNDPNPNWSNRPPKETILLDGCDFEHWLVVMEKPEGDPTRDEIIDSYIKTLATVVGSEEEARMKIYSVSTRHYYAFGALVSEELSYKLKELPKVRWVLPDSYLDVKNKDYGGEPFINGQAVPYDPKYHEEWVRNNARANERNRRNDRPRNFDRSRNFERRREMQNPGSNVGGGPPNMRNAPPPNMGGMQQQQQPNMGGMQQPGMGGPPNMQPNMGGPQQPNMGGAPHNYGGGPPRNYGGPPPSNNYGGAPNNPTNFQYNSGPANGSMPYQTGPGPNQNYASNTSSGNHYQNPNMPAPNQNYAPNMSDGSFHMNQNMPGRDPN